MKCAVCSIKVMNVANIEYFEALERLKKNKPINVPKGSCINNDTVALEAGRKRGSIKRSRKEFEALILDIEGASAGALSCRHKSTSQEQELRSKLSKLREKVKETEEKYYATLGRELSLICQIKELKEQLNKR